MVHSCQCCRPLVIWRWLAYQFQRSSLSLTIVLWSPHSRSPTQYPNTSSFVSMVVESFWMHLQIYNPCNPEPQNMRFCRRSLISKRHLLGPRPWCKVHPTSGKFLSPEFFPVGGPGPFRQWHIYPWQSMQEVGHGPWKGLEYTWLLLVWPLREGKSIGCGPYPWHSS